MSDIHGNAVRVSESEAGAERMNATNLLPFCYDSEELEELLIRHSSSYFSSFLSFFALHAETWTRRTLTTNVSRLMDELNLPIAA